MTDTTANIAAKGCNSTGITENLAEKLHAQLGKKVMAVVELVAESRAENLKGKDKVTLSILTIEPAPDHHTEEHLRELARAFYFERALDEAQPTLDGAGPERTVKDVMAAGAAHRPHPFLPVDAAQEDGICDVCGTVQSAGVHSTQEVLVDLEGDEDEPDAQLDDEDSDEPELEESDDEPVVYGREALDDDWTYDQPEPRLTAVADPFTPTGA